MSTFDEDDNPRRSADELRRIAGYQRWVIVVIFIQLAMWSGYVLLVVWSGRPFGNSLRFPMVLALILGGVGGTFTFLLYWTIRGSFAAVVMGLGAVLPCLGLFVLLVVNGTATAVFKAHGVRVGTFGGAWESDVEDDLDLDDEDVGW